MSLSRVQYPGTGTTPLYSIPFKYISKAYIEVRVGGVQIYEGAGYTWQSSTSIRLTAGNLPTGVVLDIRRRTPKELKLVDFQDGSVLTEAALDLSADQVFQLVQETVDDMDDRLAVQPDGTVDGLGRRIRNVGSPVEPDDAATKGWAETAMESNVQQAITARNEAVAARNEAVTATPGAVRVSDADTTLAKLYDKVSVSGSISKSVSDPGGSESLVLAVNVATAAEQTHSAAAKNTPSDGDEFPLSDSLASWGLKKITWAAFKTAVRQALGSMINGATSKPVVVDGDKLVIADSEASSATKSLAFSTLKTGLQSYFDTKYIPLGGSAYVPVRQTVLSGPVDASGMASFGGSVGGTVVTAAGTLKVTAAAGGDANTFSSISNPSWSGLSVNGKMYLYVEIDGAGNASTGSTPLAPIYQWGGSFSTTAGQHTFNIQEMAMRVGTGSSSAQVFRVFVGEVTVAGGVVTAVTWYSVMSRHDTGWYAVAANSTYNKSHNIGVFPTKVAQFVAQNADGSGWCVQTAAHGNSSGINQGTLLVAAGSTGITVRTGVNYVTCFADAAGAQTYPASGYARQVLERGW